MSENVEMRVDGLVFDPLTNTPIIILKDIDGDRSLPIWVGYPEATAIALQMESVTTPRPMTHDLIKNILESLSATVKNIVIHELNNNTFYAKLVCVDNSGKTMEVDSRPSDAIALSLRVNCPIYVTLEVLENAKSIEPPASQENVPDDDQAFRKWIDNIKPSDFDNSDQ